MKAFIIPVLRWTSKRKSELIRRIDERLVTEEEAMAAYNLSREEIETWRKKIARFGTGGLRVTRIQQYGAAS